MAEFPAELSTGIVHGRFIVAVIDGEDEGQEPDVIPAQGKVAFKASVGYIPVPVATGGPVTVMKGPIMGALDDEGYLCTPHPVTGEPMYRGVRLIATDDPDMAVTDWTWNADYRLEAVNGNSMQIPAHSFALPSGAELDLTTLVKVPSSPGYGLPQAEAAVLRAEAAAIESATSADVAVQGASTTDGMLAGFVSDPSTQTSTALSDTIDDHATLFNELAINVKRYGALGNGVADDTLAIQAAEAVANTGRTRPLYFPNGTYLFSHTMTAKTVVGENRQKTRLRYMGTGSAVDNGGEIAYHRRWEHLSLVGTGTGIGLNLFSSPAGSYRNMLVEHFETGIYLDDGMSLYNLFDDVTVGTTTTGVKIDGLAHESRFKNFRINYATTGIDIMGAGRTVIEASSIENCETGLVIRDRGAGRNVATSIASTRFEFNTTNYHIEPNVSKTALIGNHYIGGENVDEGLLTVLIDLNQASFEGRRVVAYEARVDQVQARSSWNDARIQMTANGMIADRNVPGSGFALRTNLAHADATGNVFEAQRKSSIVARVTNEGHVAISAKTPPPDIRVSTGEAMFWFDDTNGAAQLMVKAKQADGTVVTGGIPLT